jgi:hypothetical protein
MGLEASCKVRVGRGRQDATAHLETDHLLVRAGTERRKVPFAGLTSITASDGWLTLEGPGGTTSIELGSAAEKWADKIRNPRSLLDKLGVKPGMRVAVIGVSDEDFLQQLAARVTDISRGRPKKESDMIFVGIDTVAGLSRLPTLATVIKRNGAVWVVHRKGKGATVKDTDVFSAAKSAGLVDTKVAAFSATHTAEKLVIPLARR